MPIIYDLTGKQYGRLTVQKLSPDKNKGRRWICECECGNVITVITNGLTSGHTQSCGCLWKDTVPGHNKTHGLSNSYLHRSWGLMIQRCYNPNNPAFENYGGRGIKVCPQWRDSFATFAKDMGERPTSQHTIERRDNDGPYSPENCYWATKKQQARNRKTSRKITFDGQTKTIAEWAEVTGISSWNIRQRIDRYGWSVKKALTTKP